MKLTEHGIDWIDKVNRSRPAGGEVGIVHPLDGLHLLSAFVALVNERADELILSKRQGDMARRDAMHWAFAETVRELLGE